MFDFTKLMGMDENSPEAKMIMEGFQESASVAFEGFIKSEQGKKLVSLIPLALEMLKKDLGNDDTWYLLRNINDLPVFYILDANKIKMEMPEDGSAIKKELPIDNPIQMIREAIKNGILMPKKKDESKTDLTVVKE